MSLLTEGEKFGALEVVGLVSKEDEEPKYRLLCHRCKSDCVLCNEDALLSGRARMCWDCRQLAEMTPQQRAARAFRRWLYFTPSAVLDYVA